ncbi:MAG: hypothetical protein KAJ19_18610, partial [Gammaproteobacteria bacterium]|nr:hypothetical protein [Gammaproteobacteria bacterium]
AMLVDKWDHFFYSGGKELRLSDKRFFLGLCLKNILPPENKRVLQKAGFSVERVPGSNVGHLVIRDNLNEALEIRQSKRVRQEKVGNEQK